MERVALSEWAPHHPRYFEERARKISCAIFRRYRQPLRGPKIVRRRRTLRNLFIGEKMRMRKAPYDGPEVRYTLRDAHDNWLVVSAPIGTELYREIVGNKINSINDLEAFLGIINDSKLK